MVKLGDWINSVSYTPLLRYSLLAPLLSEYFPDGVGISPSTVRHSGSSRARLQKQREASQARERKMKEAEKEKTGEGGGQGEKGVVGEKTTGGGQGEKAATKEKQDEKGATGGEPMGAGKMEVGREGPEVKAEDGGGKRSQDDGRAGKTGDKAIGNGAI